MVLLDQLSDWILVIAGGLALWHKLHPIKEQNVHPKRPLGL